MKRIVRTLLAVTLSAALFGCGSSSAAGVPEAPAAPVMTDEDYVLETANAFMDALDSGNVQKALTYASQDLNDVFNIPELAEAKDSLKGIGFSEKSEKEFSDFINSIMDKIFGEGIRSYKLNTPEKVSDTEYKGEGVTVQPTSFMDPKRELGITLKSSIYSQDQHDYDRRHYSRNCNMERLLPSASAVNTAGFIQLLVDTR